MSDVTRPTPEWMASHGIERVIRAENDYRDYTRLEVQAVGRAARWYVSEESLRLARFDLEGEIWDTLAAQIRDDALYAPPAPLSDIDRGSALRSRA